MKGTTSILYLSFIEFRFVLERREMEEMSVELGFPVNVICTKINNERKKHDDLVAATKKQLKIV